jgi:hypothetical protein
VPLDTPVFQGHALFILKPDKPSDDPLYSKAIFEGKQRKFEVQIQGRFRKKPTGTVFIGGEITEGPMALGLVTKSLCNMLLAFCRRMNGLMHYSFGDGGNVELPHIVFPLYTSVDKFVKTPEGQTPPPMGKLFDEPDKERSKRRSSTTPMEWDTTSTYSFSFNSMYVDLPAWKLVGLPMMKDMDLHTFWSESGLRLVVYESTATKAAKHKKADNAYMLCIEMRHVPEGVEEGEGRTESLPWGRVSAKSLSNVEKFGQLLVNDNDDTPENGHDTEQNGDGGNNYDDDDDDEEEDSSDDEGFYDAMDRVQGLSVGTRTNSSVTATSFAEPLPEESQATRSAASSTADTAKARNSIESVNSLDSVTAGSLSTDSSEAVLSMDKIQHSIDPRRGSAVDILSPLSPIDEKTDFVGHKLVMNSNNLCPGFVDMCDPKIKSKYTRVYAFAVDGMTKTVFRKPDEFNKFFPMEVADIARNPPRESVLSPRLATSEVQRRIMGSALKQAIISRGGSGRGKSADKHLNSFAVFITDADKSFLRGPRRSAVVATSGPNGAGVLLEGAVARASSETHFIEEWAVLTNRFLSFYHPDNKSPTFRIPVADILQAKKLDDRERPSFPTYHFIEIETTSRMFYCMLQNETLLKRWTEFINDVAQKFRSSSITSKGRGSMNDLNINNLSFGSTTPSSSGHSMSDALDTASNDPSDGFLHKSSLFKCKNRRLLNCKKFVFRGSLFDDTESAGDAQAIVADALRRALEPQEHELEDDNLRDFLSAASELKRVRIADMTEVEKLTFFMNLYHLMITHAYLVLGAPSSAYKWFSYFNMISYQCSDDIFSLTELEHCIIRAGMNYPKQFFSKWVLPKSRYSFACTLNDQRINFALNCGSKSNPPSVPIYVASRLDVQLNLATSYYLQESVTVSMNGRGQKQGVVVVLPMILSWYANDFGRGRSIDLVRFVHEYLTGERKALLTLALDGTNKNKAQYDSNSYLVKYTNYDFVCRTISLLDEDLLQILLTM